MRWLLVLLATSGCGRLGFETERATDGDDGGIDASDGPSGICAGADLCDGFEAGLDAGTWSSVGAVVLDQSRAHRGSASVRVTTPALNPNQNAYSTIYESKTLGPGGTFWVRGWYWLSALPAGANGMELVVAGQLGGSGDFVFVFNDGTHLYSQFAELSQITTDLVPVGQWFCVIMKVVPSPTTGTLEVTGDLSPLTLANVATDGTPPLDYIGLGIGFASNNLPTQQPSLDLWIDDVLIDRAPVTCAD